MAHQLHQPPPGFDDLAAADQVEYVQALWDRIAAQSSGLPVPAWHFDIVQERLADLEANPEAERPWEEFEQELADDTAQR